MTDIYINPILQEGEVKKELGMWGFETMEAMRPQLQGIIDLIDVLLSIKLNEAPKEKSKPIDTKAIVEKLEEPLKPKVTKIPPVPAGMHPCGLSDKEVEKIREAKELGLKNLKELYKSIGDKLNISTTIAKEKVNKFEEWKEKVRNGQHTSQNITGF